MADCKSSIFANSTLYESCLLSKSCSYNFINFYEIHFCKFEGKLFISVPMLISFSFFCFYLLSDTANKYLSQALTNISDKLKFSQNLAGVTILAFGNGANDVISSIIASKGEGQKGLDVAIGSLLGGGIFVSCLVFSMVVFISKKIEVNF